MKQHLKAIGKTDTWITPKYITDALGHFDLDPCMHTDMPWSHAEKGYTIYDDGLKSPWFGRVWVNPPFNKKEIDLWMKKMYEHKNGILLTGAAFETKRFQKYVWGKATGVLVLDHRPYFCNSSGEKGRMNCGQTICLIAYDEKNLQALIDSKLGIVLQEIKHFSLNTK